MISEKNSIAEGQEAGAAIVQLLHNMLPGLKFRSPKPIAFDPFAFIILLIDKETRESFRHNPARSGSINKRILHEIINTSKAA